MRNDWSARSGVAAMQEEHQYQAKRRAAKELVLLIQSKSWDRVIGIFQEKLKLPMTAATMSKGTADSILSNIRDIANIRTTSTTTVNFERDNGFIVTDTNNEDDDNNYTILHLLCLHRAPLHVIREFLYPSTFNIETQKIQHFNDSSNLHNNDLKGWALSIWQRFSLTWRRDVNQSPNNDKCKETNCKSEEGGKEDISGYMSTSFGRFLIHSLLQERDARGWTPLHVAILHSSCCEVIFLLIECGIGLMNKNRHHSYCISIDSEVHLLQDQDCTMKGHYREKAPRLPFINIFTILNNAGWTPLHLACRHNISENVLHRLVMACPYAVLIDSHSGLNPLQILWMTRAAMALRQSLHSTRLSEGEGRMNMSDVLNSNPPIAQFWDKMSFLIMVAYIGPSVLHGIGLPQRPSQLDAIHENHNSITDDLNSLVRVRVPCNSNIVQAATFLSLEGLIPVEVVHMAIAIYPEKLRYRDENLDLPLHVAASRIRNVNRNSYSDGPTDGDPIHCILQKWPDAARIANARGRIPLSLALEAGRDWASGIEQIVNAAPVALQTRDVATHLYPYMLAAVATSVGSNSVSPASLGTVFELLSACPHAVQNR